MSLKGKTLFITGASRGIGKAIALRAAKDGANIVVVAKTATPHPKLEGTIFTAAAEIEKAGGHALAITCDIRFEEQVKEAVKKAVETFGGIDILVNNASALFPQSVTELDLKRLDLIYSINVRGTFCVTKYVLPHLLQSSKTPHILNLSPPISLNPKWLSPGAAYASTKYSMSLFALGWAEEFRGKIAVNALWPKTTIATAALRQIGELDDLASQSRSPDIMADAAYVILTQPLTYTGNLTVDEPLLASAGVKDFSKYAMDPTKILMSDYFIDEGYTFAKPSSAVEPMSKTSSSAVAGDSLSLPGFKASDYFTKINANFLSLSTEKRHHLSKQVNAVFEFEIHNKNGKVQIWTIDFKNGVASVKLGKSESFKPDISMIFTDDDFCKMASGQISGQKLFMTGKLKMKGNVMLATKLDAILKGNKANL